MTLEIILTILGSIISSIFAYHKYLMSILDKKMDKEDCGKQQELLTEKRNNLELLITERTKTIFEQQKAMREDIGIIKEYITRNKITRIGTIQSLFFLL